MLLFPACFVFHLTKVLAIYALSETKILSKDMDHTLAQAERHLM